MNPLLASLVWAVLATPRKPDELVWAVQEYAYVHKDAIARTTLDLQARYLVKMENGRWQRAKRPVLTLGQTYKRCACGRHVPTEYRMCRTCAEVKA